MIEEDLRSYREKASQIGVELNNFKKRFEVEKHKSYKIADKWEKELFQIRGRLEKLNAVVFKK